MIPLQFLNIDLINHIRNRLLLHKLFHFLLHELILYDNYGFKFDVFADMIQEVKNMRQFIVGNRLSQLLDISSLRRTRIDWSLALKTSQSLLFIQIFYLVANIIQLLDLLVSQSDTVEVIYFQSILNLSPLVWTFTVRLL